jgi:uncharacterized damage-inducible protein DinB
MSQAMLLDVFAHHVWATNRLIDACATLDASLLATAVPGTSRSILDTLRHLVGSDSWDLFTLTDEPDHRVEEANMDPAALRSTMLRNGERWSSLLGQDLDPDAVVLEIDDEGAYERRAPVSLRIAGALDHGSDHRSQICTALTLLGVTPPRIDAMDFGLHDGRVAERYEPHDAGPV